MTQFRDEDVCELGGLTAGKMTVENSTSNKTTTDRINYDSLHFLRP